MDTDEHSAACAAATGFGVRREAKRHAAFGRRTTLEKRGRHRTPNLCRPCAKLQDCSTDSAGQTPALLCLVEGHWAMDRCSPWKSTRQSSLDLCLSVSICGCIE